MKKRNYRAQKVNEIRWEAMSQRVEGKALVFAVDVAKVEQYGQRAGGGGHGEVDAPGGDTGAA